MGVKVPIKGSEPYEVYPAGEYLTRIIGHKMVTFDPTKPKVKIEMVIVGGPLDGKKVNRSFNFTVSERSGLGQFLTNFGIYPQTLAGQKDFDLDVLNGAMVFATVSPYNSQNGLRNGISAFRRADAGTPPTARVQPQPTAFAPAPQVGPTVTQQTPYVAANYATAPTTPQTATKTTTTAPKIDF